MRVRARANCAVSAWRRLALEGQYGRLHPTEPTLLATGASIGGPMYCTTALSGASVAVSAGVWAG